MSSSPAVALEATPNGVIQDASGNALSGRQLYVYQRGTTTQVQVYADATLVGTLSQPLTTGVDGSIPGYVAGGTAIDFYDIATTFREPAEPLAVANTVTGVTVEPADNPPGAVLRTAAPFITGRLSLRDKYSAADFGMKFTGNDETTLFQEAVLGARQNGKELWLPEGQTVVTGTLTDITDLTHSLRVRGAGRDKTTIIHEVTGAPVFELLGGGLTTITTLGSPIAVGVQQLTGLGTTTGLTAGDYILLRDTSSGITGDGSEAGGSANEVVSLAGEWARVFSVDSSTQITLYGYTNWPLAAGTTVLKLAYIKQPIFRDFTVLNPNPRTNTTGARVFQTNYVIRPRFENLGFEQLDAPGIYMQWNVGWKVIDCHFKDLEDDTGTSAARMNPGGASTTGTNPYGIAAGRACAHGLVLGCEQTNGRHMFTTLNAFNGTTTTEIGPQHILVANCIASEMFHAAFDCHPGARWINFVNDVVHNTAWDAFQIRGTDCSVINPTVVGANRGVFVPFGADRTRVMGGRLGNVKIGVESKSSDDVEIGGGLLIDSPITNGILIDTPDANWSGHVTKMGIDDVRITGNPSDAAIRFQGSAWSGGFKLGRKIDIPTATNKILGATPFPALASAPASASRRAVALRPTSVLWENRSRDQNTSATVAAPTSGTMNVYIVELPAGLPISDIGFVSGATAAGTPTHQWFGLYDNNRLNLALTSDDTTTAWAAHHPKALVVTGGPFITTYEGLYYVGLLVVATTPPTLTGTEAPSCNLSPAMNATTSLTATTPVSTTPSGISEIDGSPYIYFE